MTKHKVTFTKYRDKGQTSFERSLTIEGLEIIFALCDDVKVHRRKKKSGSVTFIFNGGELNKFVSAKNLPFWILKKFLPEKEWT